MRMGFQIQFWLETGHRMNKNLIHVNLLQHPSRIGSHGYSQLQIIEMLHGLSAWKDQKLLPEYLSPTKNRVAKKVMIEAMVYQKHQWSVLQHTIKWINY